MTPLRQRMIEDMQLRNFSAGTQKSYVYYIFGLARFYLTSPQDLGLEEIRDYQLYMINDYRYSAETVNCFVSAAKFLYNVTLETPWPENALPRARVPHRLPNALSSSCAKCAFKFLRQWCSAPAKWTLFSSTSIRSGSAPL